MTSEPAAIIGLIASLVVVVAQTVLGSGLIVSNTGQSLLNLLITLAPLIAGLLIRSQVVPTSTVEEIPPKAAA